MIKIYVGNLSFEETDESLARIFRDFGHVKSAEIVLFRKSGQSRGFGFVEMDDTEGKLAIEALNGKEVNGRTLKVNISDPNENNIDLDNGDLSRIYVGNLTQEADVYFLAKVFSTFGKISSAMVIYESGTEKHEGFGFVEMITKGSAIRAIEELDGKEVDGMVLRVNWAKPKPKKNLRSRPNY